MEGEGLDPAASAPPAFATAPLAPPAADAAGFTRGSVARAGAGVISSTDFGRTVGRLYRSWADPGMENSAVGTG
jgi:hypothetical protein